MARDKTKRRVLAVDTADPPNFAPKHLSKREFAERVKDLTLKQGWNMSDLARAATIAGPVEVTRDNVSKYFNGLSLPTLPKLKALAGALKVTPDELLPNHMQKSLMSAPSPTRFEVSANPQIAWLQVNRFVHTATAVQIVGLLQQDDATTDRE